MEKQGASQGDIQGYLDSQKGQGSVQTMTPPTPQFGPLSGNQNSTFMSYDPQRDAQGSILGSGAKAGGKALANIVPSAVNAGIGLGKAAVNVFNPNMENNTLANLGRIAVGGAQKLIPGEQGSEKNFDSLIGAFKNRYGSLDAATNTAVEDPFGFGSDVAALFTGGATLVGKGAKAANVVNKVGELTKATKVNDYFANVMQKTTFNLNANQKAKFANSLADTAEYLNKIKAVGTPEMKFNRVQREINTKYEPVIQKTLARNRDITVPTRQVQDSILSIKNNEKIFDDGDFDSITKRLDTFSDSLSRYRESIPVDSLNRLKRSVFKNAYNSAGDKVTDVLEFAIGDKLYENLVATLKQRGVNFNGMDLDVFNAPYQKAINAQKILNMGRKRPLAGLLSKGSAVVGSMFFGNMIGGPAVGILAPLIAPKAAGVVGGVANMARGAAAKAIKQGSRNVPVATPAVISGTNLERDSVDQ